LDGTLIFCAAPGGKPYPNFRKDVELLPGGVSGGYLQCGRVKAPLDLFPKIATVALTFHRGASWKEGSVTVETSGGLPEITERNNRLKLMQSEEISCHQQPLR
jgi:hypothetical protein